MNRPIFLSLLLLVFGCSKANPPAAIETVVPVSPSPLVSVSPSPSTSPVSQALPELQEQEVLGELDSTNDLLDSFYFDGNGIKMSLKVGGSQACYVYIRRSTPEKLGEIEMESLVRERAGLWRGSQTGRQLAQGAGNKLNIYQNNELLTSYENPSISLDQAQAVKDLNERKSAFSLLLRQDLSISESAKRVYTNQCQGLKGFYYKEELPSLTVAEQAEFERSIKNLKD
ncbi:hypothetical protein [Chlorogloea sp. CCALA 695]|uniref:hypothetical protein n=1 Tax=Chlorogloea sp. CCALA 695 TaxID=2107693 RepID=UPI000D06AD02|nr:hypothetical protein [Chlorogloea sp. CCALA 695]PSB30824.1 hypothetical protein C7B70_15325 [Chlorogloea sp. CCALA 695]